MNIHWQALAWEALTRDALYDVLALRARVFVLEQDCPYLDPDGADPGCHHLLGRLAAPARGMPEGTLVAYSRVPRPGLKYPEPSIGRVVTASELRGTSLGRDLIARGVALCESLYPGQAIRISAQAHLARLYGEFGFEPVGEMYLEDDIPHQEMLRPARTSSTKR